MNRKQRRAQEKQRRQSQKANVQSSSDYVVDWFSHKDPKAAKPVPKIPGVNCIPDCPDFTEKVNINSWHDISELDSFVETIKQLSTKPGWSWSRNWNCKYVNIRIDMRDGGFVFSNDADGRINLEQLKWQFKT